MGSNFYITISIEEIVSFERCAASFEVPSSARHLRHAEGTAGYECADITGFEGYILSVSLILLIFSFFLLPHYSYFLIILIYLPYDFHLSPSLFLLSPPFFSFVSLIILSVSPVLLIIGHEFDPSRCTPAEHDN